ncbi:UDP-N-acetylmuramate dehydrogenase [Vibrio sp.]|uniref:UDP-N-acetylmuramate dehydrogenase n=1 Tax=Vibrio sp. TaxID=678 RepID=UPI003D0AF90C
MQSLSDVNLQPYHTFAIPQRCQHLVEIQSLEQLIQAYRHPGWQSLPKLMVGKGSNLLFTEPFQGVVLINRLSGIEVSETDQHWHLHVAAGEDWPSLVKWSVENGYDGLENLALIPGCAGSAPIQNIGAYGVELKDVCEYVDILCLQTFTVKRLSNQDCQFGYRDSVFKHRLYQQAVVVAIGLRLAKQWQASASYGPLQALPPEQRTATAIYQRVCDIRREKLPDPAEYGNAGSFFKNPVISEAHYQQLQQRYPQMVAYPVADGVKIAAGWLIDQCGLKGLAIGGAQVHPKQALVLVNQYQASAEDVIRLAAEVRGRVVEKYGIELEHEVRFIGAWGETNLSEILEAQQ